MGIMKRRILGDRLPIWGLSIILGLILLMGVVSFYVKPDLKFSLPTIGSPISVSKTDIQQFIAVAVSYSFSLIGIDRMTDTRFALLGCLVAIPLLVFLELLLARQDPTRAKMFVFLIGVIYLYPIIQRYWGSLGIGFARGPHLEGPPAFFLVLAIGVWLITKLGIVDFNPPAGLLLVVGGVGAGFLTLGYLGELVKFGGEGVPALVYPASTTYQLLKVYIPLALWSAFVLAIVYMGWSLSCYELLRLGDTTSISVTAFIAVVYLWERAILGISFPIAMVGALVATLFTSSLLVAMEWSSGALWEQYPFFGLSIVVPWNTLSFIAATFMAGLMTFGRV